MFLYCLYTLRLFPENLSVFFPFPPVLLGSRLAELLMLSCQNGTPQAPVYRSWSGHVFKMGIYLGMDVLSHLVTLSMTLQIVLLNTETTRRARENFLYAEHINLCLILALQGYKDSNVENSVFHLRVC